MGDLHREPPEFPERLWGLVRAPESAARDPDAVLRHAVQVLLRLERGSPQDPPERVLIELYALLRDDGGQRYAPPELRAGHPMTQRSLVYAFGVLVYEQITGEHPFGGQPPHDDAPVDYGVLPPRLAPAVRRAMAARPEERFGNLAMMRMRLEEIASGRAPELRDASPAPPPSQTRIATAPPEKVEPPEERSVISDFAVPEFTRRETTKRGMGVLPPAPQVVPDTTAELPRVRGEAGTRAAKAQGVAVRQGAPPERYHEPTAPKPRAQLRPWLYAALGAGIATIVMVVVLHRPAQQAQQARSEAVQSGAPPEPAPAPASPADATQAAPPSPMIETGGAGFDPERAGTVIAERARTCFSAAQLVGGVRFGFSGVFGVDGVLRRVYFPASPELTPEEQACLGHGAVGVSTGPPARVTIVGYGVHLASDKSEVRIRSQH